MQFSKCRWKLVVESAFSLVQNHNTFISGRLLSALVANVARDALSQTYFGWWASFSAQFWTYGIHIFFLGGTATIGTLGRRSESVVGCASFLSCWCCSISVHGPASFGCCGLVERRSRKSQENFARTRGFTFGDTVTHFCNSFQCSRMLRAVEHMFLLVSSFFCITQGAYFDFVTCAH